MCAVKGGLMKTLSLALACSSLVLIVGCGSPALTCQTTTCSSGVKTYQTCANLNGSVTYNFGGMSCNCPPGNTTQCQSCAAQVAAYCSGGGGGGGAGGGGGGGGAGGGGGCTYTVSGAVTASGTCMAMAAYDSKNNTGVGFTVTDGQTFNFAASIANQTMLTAGTYTLASVQPGAGAEFLQGLTTVWSNCTTTQNCNDAKGNKIPPQGSFTLIITSGNHRWARCH